jgi:hypothetical protein
LLFGGFNMSKLNALVNILESLCFILRRHLGDFTTNSIRISI